MSKVLKIISPGVGLSLQDQGRIGWRRYGIPPGGVMDPHAASGANRLLENVPGAAVLEILLNGAKLECLVDCWVAVTGASGGASIAHSRAVRLRSGETIAFGFPQAGVWSYLAVAGGFRADLLLGSASYYARAKLGTKLEKGSILESSPSSFHLPAGVRGRLLPWDENRNYLNPPPIQVWPGPQIANFSKEDQEQFFTEPWMISPQSDRVGYRLKGPLLRPSPSENISEPVLPGSIQVPEKGEPIITMRDGPTVGGYPKIAIVEPSELGWVAQARPGQKLRFKLIS